MQLVRLEKALLRYGDQVLLDHVDLSIEAGSRIGLLGRNGEGKSTLLKVIAGSVALDDGQRWQRPSTRIARLEQVLPDREQMTVFDFVASGLEKTGELLSRFLKLSTDPNTDLKVLARVQEELEQLDGWRLRSTVESVLSQLDLPADNSLSELSGGWRRRAALARALVGDPDVLLLDEPTNHLDIPAIDWLQRELAELKCALILISHDRRFLRESVDSIAELDRGHLTVWQGDYAGFLRYRDEAETAEASSNALFDKKLAQEERWIRQGIQARRTRNEGRVRALKAMREARRARRDKQGRARFHLDAAERSGKRVAELIDVSYGYGDKLILKDCSLLIERGDRIGIVGPNGAGKSTLLQLVTGGLSASQGTIKLGTSLEVAYIDQLRSQLDPDKNLIDNICEGREYISINGKQKHSISYLGEFLFAPARVRTPIRTLSGGEQNRAILAKLFSKPANLLILDEPTNDLDIESLELLEELLVSFTGTIIVVSHDREFLDNVVTSLLILTGDGLLDEQAGGYSDWEARGGRLVAIDHHAPRDEIAAPKNDDSPAPAVPVVPNQRPKKLSYIDKLELERLPNEIEALEQELARYQSLVEDPAFYEQQREVVNEALTKLATVEKDLEAKLERWMELED
ncbi:MAG: ATP-binding cassette domain-containing protein [Pseudomonadota bacterium]